MATYSKCLLDLGFAKPRSTVLVAVTADVEYKVNINGKNHAEIKHAYCEALISTRAQSCKLHIYN